MGQKKEGNALNSGKYLRRAVYHDSIEELASVMKDLFKETLHIRYECTFLEIKDAVKRKHLSPGLQLKITSLCDSFEEMEYRPKKPAAKEISKVKGMLKEVIREILPAQEKQAKMPPFGGMVKKAQKIKQKQTDIARKVEKGRQDLQKSIIRKFKAGTKQASVKYDKEAKEIHHFIAASLSLGMHLQEIRKELKEMGFPKDKTEAVIKKM